MCDFIKSCYAAPRINKMADFFSSTASGVKHKPLKHVKIDNRLFPSPEYIIFSDYLTKNSGPFVNHYFCSIPYSKEEECRLGVTIMKYASHRNKPLSLWCLGMAEGAMARTISQLSKGQVLSLTTSPTKENEPVFFSHGSHIHSYFICSPFFLVHEEIKNNNPELFPHGFDIIIEDTTFQMYSPDREQQIKHVKKH